MGGTGRKGVWPPSTTFSCEGQWLPSPRRDDAGTPPAPLSRCALLARALLALRVLSTSSLLLYCFLNSKKIGAVDLVAPEKTARPHTLADTRPVAQRLVLSPCPVASHGHATFVLWQASFAPIQGDMIGQSAPRSARCFFSPASETHLAARLACAVQACVFGQYGDFGSGPTS